MLNCVHETSVRAAVVLSVGLLRLVSRACVVDVLRVVLVLLLDLEEGTTLFLMGFKGVLVEDEDGDGTVDVDASVAVASAAAGMS